MKGGRCGRERLGRKGEWAAGEGRRQIKNESVYRREPEGIDGEEKKSGKREEGKKEDAKKGKRESERT